MAQRTIPSVNRNSGRTDRIRRRRLAVYNTPSKPFGGVIGRTREKDNAERKATGRKRSINRSARSLYATPRRSESRAGGRIRRTPFHSGKFAVDVDDNEIAARYQQIMDIYARGKINTKNAWRLKLVENIERMISLEAHGNFKKCSATIAAATQIYHYRVDDVYTNTFKMLNNFGGVGDSTGVSAKKKKPHNINTLISSKAANVDLNRVVSRVDPMFHKTTSAFDEGGSRGLLMNNLSVHNGCDIIFDSTTVVTKRSKKGLEEKKVVPNEEEGEEKLPKDDQENLIPEKKSTEADEGDDSDEEHQSWVSTVSASHEVYRFQAREICPAVSAITDAIGKVEEAEKKRQDLPTDSGQRGPKRLNFADDPNEVMDFANVDPAMFDGNEFNPEQQEADMLLELERSQQHPDYFYTSSANNSMEVPNYGSAKPQPSIPHGDYSVYLDSDPRVTEEYKENYFFHPSLLNSWTGPERWISRRQLFRRRFKQLQQNQAEEKKKAKKRDITEHQINFMQIVDGVQCPDEYFCPPKRPFSTMLTMASQEKLRNDLNIYPEDLHIDRKILTQLFMKPSLHVSRRVRTSGESDYENDAPADFWENELDVTCARSEQFFDADPMGSPKANYEGLQLVNDRPDVGPLVVEYARISKKINIKTLKENIWRFIQKAYSSEATAGQAVDTPAASAAAAAGGVVEPKTEFLEETLEQPDRGIMLHQGATTFKSTLKQICTDSRQKDELSVPFAFMALLHLANLKSLRFVPMKNTPFGSDFHIYADKVGSGS